MTAALAALRRVGALGALNFVTLAIAFAALVLLARLLAYEFSFDQQINPKGDVYRLGSMITHPGRAAAFVPGGYASTAEAVRAQAPAWIAARAATGLEPQEIRAGETIVNATISSAEAEIARVLAIETLHGDLAVALRRPEGVALTLTASHQLFGTAGSVGRTLETGGQAFTVGAVIADWPRNSSFRDFRIIISGANAASDIRTADAPRDFVVAPGRSMRITVFGKVLTYVKASGDDKDVRARLDAIANADIARHTATSGLAAAGGMQTVAHTVPLSRANLVSEGARAAGEQGADPAALTALTGLGITLLVIASLNFVSVAATRAAARAKEVAIRKTFGATRFQLGSVAIGRSIAAACGAALLGTFIAFILRGWFANLVGREISLAPTPGLVIAILAAGIVTGVAAGLLPMLTLTSPRPSVILQTRSRRAGQLRAILLGVQVVAASVSATFGFVIAAQYGHLVGEDTLHVRKADIAYAKVAPVMKGGMSEDRMRALVARAATAQDVELAATGPVPARGGLATPLNLATGTEPLEADAYEISPDYFALLGVRPLAGRFFRPSEGGSLLQPRGILPVILDRTTSARLGFASPAMAIGQTVQFAAGTPGVAQVVGVVPDVDFSADRSARHTSTIFAPGFGHAEDLLIRTRDGRAPVATLAPIARSVSAEAERSVATLSSAVAAKYADIGRLLGAITVLAVLGLLSTALGAAGLAASLSSEMAFEAAVRKSFGAVGSDIIRLFAARVAWPIVAGVAVGVPTSLWAVGAWLEYYPERVQLGIAPGVASAMIFVGLIAAVLAWRGLGLARLRPGRILRQL